MSTVDSTRKSDRPPAETDEPSSEGARREPPVLVLAEDLATAKRPAFEPSEQPIEYWYFCGDGSMMRQP